ncbi:glutamyl-trna amidotransferase subunit a [Moniliophthora roreri MCA 2997]|uniref:Glutamyl-trna amidotransferase subunit a n=1 Tax=Moniliophthora roreri (strain MCA 2997) TaxID=1381753 RepID=V2XJW4_MONRO|nr:glutamyl-trna amidotransferase subunit a [Moniliophthora roreri MCA 2997]
MAQELPDLYEAGILDLQEGLDSCHYTSVELVKAYLARINEVNPYVRAVLETNPMALQQAEQLDVERREKGKRTVLHGIPVLLKDNIATLSSEGMNTTAGSLALLNSVVPDDAGIVKRLREAGAIILGKTNMSELAHFRGDTVPCGWSARGGQCLSPYHPQGDSCGSSSGSGVAASVGLATVTIGTETSGSICFPSSNNNIVGIKPTVGLTSRAGVIPISGAQDTVGPMTRSVEDAAIVLSIIAGEDENDGRTLSQPLPVPDYIRSLDTHALRGKRIGVPRKNVLTNHLVHTPQMWAAFDEALNIIEELGATILDPADLPSADELLSNDMITILSVDFKIELNQYLKWLEHVPTGVQTLTDLIKFNQEHADLELPEDYDQSRLIKSDATTGRSSEYDRALARNLELGATKGIDAVLKEYNLDALVFPGIDSAIAAALAGYPIITVPLSFYPDDTPVTKTGPKTVYPAPGLPIGLSFIGLAFSEYDLLGYAYAFEQKTKTRLMRKAYPSAVPRTQLKDVIGRA